MGARHRGGLRGIPQGWLDAPDDGRHREGVGCLALIARAPSRTQKYLTMAGGCRFFQRQGCPNPTGLARAPRYLYPMLLRRVAFPDFCEPCLPSPAEKPPAGAGWLHDRSNTTAFR